MEAGPRKLHQGAWPRMKDGYNAYGSFCLNFCSLQLLLHVMLLSVDCIITCLCVRWHRTSKGPAWLCVPALNTRPVINGPSADFDDEWVILISLVFDHCLSVYDDSWNTYSVKNHLWEKTHIQWYLRWYLYLLYFHFFSRFLVPLMMKQYEYF